MSSSKAKAPEARPPSMIVAMAKAVQIELQYTQQGRSTVRRTSQSGCRRGAAGSVSAMASPYQYEDSVDVCPTGPAGKVV